MSDATPFPPLRRVVTAHDEHGQAIVGSDGPYRLSSNWRPCPARSSTRCGAPREVRLRLETGLIRQLARSGFRRPAMGPAFASSTFRPTPRISSARREDNERRLHRDRRCARFDGEVRLPHPLMHRTEVDRLRRRDLRRSDARFWTRARRVLREADVVIQRGTNHAWANRSGKPCRMLFILVDGRFEPGIPGAMEAS